MFSSLERPKKEIKGWQPPEPKKTPRNTKIVMRCRYPDFHMHQL